MKDNKKLGGGKAPKGMIEETTEGIRWGVVFVILVLVLFWALFLIIIL